MGSIAYQNTKSRVLIVDDHTLVRIGLTDLINRHSRFEVVGVASSCTSGLNLASQLLPDIIILDTELADSSGCTSLRRVSALSSDISIMLYSSNQDHNFIDNAFKYQIAAYVLKSSPLDAMLHAIEIVNQGMQFVDPGLSSYLPGETDRKERESGPKSVLTDREQTILSMLALGKANKEIANELFITERTVKFHVSAILKRLNVRNRTHAVRVAIEAGLLPGQGASKNDATDIVRIPQTRQTYDRRQESQIHPQFERRNGRGRRKVDRYPQLAFSNG